MAQEDFVANLPVIVAWPVAAFCGPPRRCWSCVAGSEYAPGPGAPPHPAHAARRAAARVARQTARATPAAQGGRQSGAKGRRREREFARRFGGTRVPLSGMLPGLANDVVLPNGWRAEVKSRAARGQLVYRWLDAADAVAFRVPGQPWLVALPEPIFAASGTIPTTAAWPGRPSLTVVYRLFGSWPAAWAAALGADHPAVRALRPYTRRRPDPAAAIPVAAGR